MVSLEQILAMWKKDCVIDEMNLDTASIDGARLHSKYLEIVSLYKLRLRKQESQFKVLLQKRWMWYNGKMSQHEMDELGWDYDAMKGLKVLRGDMDKFYDADPLLQAELNKIEYTKTILDTLKEIMDTIRWRHVTIKNAISWRQFVSGS